MRAPGQSRSPWLFSREVDLGVFGGSAALSLVLLWIGPGLARGAGELPTVTWVATVLMVDVAHVWSTGFRVYFDPNEVKRRPVLYVGVPLVSYALLVALHRLGHLVFWRSLAYLAVFHFVRQQAGWLALYRARAGEKGLTTRVVDSAAIYGATLYPLAFWHTHARSFDWFVPGDIVHVSFPIDRVALPLYLLSIGAYAARSLGRLVRREPGTPGKDLVVVSTAACWYLGIVVFDSDYTFTVTNVLIHGVPYVALIYAYGRAQERPLSHSRLPVILLTIWAFAYVEELVWDRALWHDRPALFGDGWDVPSLNAFLVPLLAVPQVVHYVLDGIIWRRAANPGVTRMFRAPAVA